MGESLRPSIQRCNAAEADCYREGPLNRHFNRQDAVIVKNKNNHADKLHSPEHIVDVAAKMPRIRCTILDAPYGCKADAMVAGTLRIYHIHAHKADVSGRESFTKSSTRIIVPATPR